MLAIDTNLVVRYLAGDDPAQSARARKMIDDNEVFVPTIVLLEAGWVLRSHMGDPPTVGKALGWMRQGSDFADALHLAACSHCDAFISFDRGFARAANALGGTRVRVPQAALAEAPISITEDRQFQ